MGSDQDPYSLESVACWIVQDLCCMLGSNRNLGLSIAIDHVTIVGRLLIQWQHSPSTSNYFAGL